MRCRICAAALLLAIPAFADWHTYIDRKPNQISGTRNAYAEVKGKGLSTATLQVGCIDGKTIVHITNGFRGFKVEGTPGAYYSPVKVRASSSPKYFELQAPAMIFHQAMHLFLDEKSTELIPQMKQGGSLFIELLYPEERKVTEFRLEGLDLALGRLAEAGCRP